MNLLPRVVHQKADDLVCSLSSLLSVRDQLLDRTDSINKVGRSKFWIDPELIRQKKPPFIPAIPELPRVSDIKQLKSVEKDIYQSVLNIGKRGFNLMKWANIQDHKLFQDLDEIFVENGAGAVFDATSEINQEEVQDGFFDHLRRKTYDFDETLNLTIKRRMDLEARVKDQQILIKELVGVVAKLQRKNQQDYEVHQNMRSGLLYILESIRLMQRYTDLDVELEDGKAALNQFVTRAYQGIHFAVGTKPIRVPGCPRANVFHDLLENDYFAFVREVRKFF